MIAVMVVAHPSVMQDSLKPISKNKRYIARNGFPVLIPNNPIEFIKSKILSTKSKLQFLLEPYAWKKKRVSDDHTQERSLIVSLIPSLLVQVLEIPNLFQYGSVIAGAIQSKLSSRKEKGGETKGSQEKGKHRRGSFSFQGGMQTLIDTLCNQLGKHELKLNSKVLSLSYSHGGNSTSENWSVSCVANDGKPSQSSSVDAVILMPVVWRSATMLALSTMSML